MECQADTDKIFLYTWIYPLWQLYTTLSVKCPRQRNGYKRLKHIAQLYGLTDYLPNQCYV